MYQIYIDTALACTARGWPEIKAVMLARGLRHIFVVRRGLGWNVGLTASNRLIKSSAEVAA